MAARDTQNKPAAGAAPLGIEQLVSCRPEDLAEAFTEWHSRQRRADGIAGDDRTDADIAYGREAAPYLMSLLPKK